MAFIKDITITISKANYGDCARLKEILTPYRYYKTRSSYKIRGTFDELEDLVASLLSAERCSASTTQGPARRASPHASACDTPLTVSALVMDYIQQRCAEKLKQIQGQHLIIEVQDSLKPEHRNTLQVTFRSRSESLQPPGSVSVDFAKHRFITFYQRTASDLQATALSLSPHDPNDLQRQFPLLLFKPSSSPTVTVTGPFANIHKLKAFLSQHSPKLSGSPVNRVPHSSPSRKASSPSPKHSKQDEVELCPICMEPIRAGENKTLQCKHSFCCDCLSKAFHYKPVCPICGEVYGILRGVQPDGGKMKASKTSSSLPGYEGYGTITIHYHIPDGIQKKEHPNPGQSFEGVHRTAYLPDSPEGRKILQLLRRAFDQRLIFTIGQSTTSGRSNVVTWNDIHHKTSTHGGPTLFGYPDPDYFHRVREELKVKGIE